MRENPTLESELRRLGRRLRGRLDRCPDAGRLRLYALDELSESDRQATMLHLDLCAVCRGRLPEAAAAPDWSTALAEVRHRLPRRALDRRLFEQSVRLVQELRDLWRLPTFTPFPAAATRSGDPAGSLEKAMEPYTRGDLGAARRALQDHLEKHPDDHEAMFFLGATWLEQGQSALAVEVLDQALQLAGPLPPLRYRWSLIEALLLTGQAAEACRLLRSIVAAGGQWAARAEHVLSRLSAAA